MNPEDKDLISELLRQIGVCEQQVNAYSNKRDKDAKNMWYIGMAGGRPVNRCWHMSGTGPRSRRCNKRLFM